MHPDANKPIVKIFTAPYDTMNGFIEESHSYHLEQLKEQSNRRVRPGAHSSDMMSYWGYKFETVSVLSEPWDAASRETIEARESDVVNNNPQYCSLVRTGIGNIRMLLAGEVDAVWDCKPDKKDDPINWVELKTSATIRHANDAINFERKLLKFWVQSFLLGVPKIIVGRRDQDGYLLAIEEYTTDEIPNIPKRGANTWDANTCINFASQFLTWLKTIVNSEGVWKIRKAAKSGQIEVLKIQETGHGNILTPEFVEWRSRG
ncbi:hypothetical protein H101_03183 [Trichophyton interdigitale H6]|nr:hypothetical protein H101_03183 [Trichophyton interdigitale H6]